MSTPRPRLAHPQHVINTRRARGYRCGMSVGGEGGAEQRRGHYATHAPDAHGPRCDTLLQHEQAQERTKVLQR
eukprot:1308353-Rhodomonas_salina.1